MAYVAPLQLREGSSLAEDWGSTGLDTIRYLSTHNNQYIRYFQGHTAPVTCLSMSPGSDEFLSCSMDNNVRIWSLNTPNATGKLILNGAYLATYDPSATVIAVASPVCNSILLYDVRKYDKAPFASFDMVELEAGYNAKAIDAAVARTKDSDPSSHAWNPGKWATLDFSNDGKSLVLGTRSGLGHYLLDAFTGSLRAFCTLNRPSAGLEDAGNGAAPPSSTTTTTTTTMIEPTPIIRSRPRLAPGNRSSTPGGPAPAQGDVCFSPDGRYLVGGAGDQNLFVWDTQQVLQPSSSTPSSSSSLSSPMALPNGSINPDTRTVGMGGKIVDDDHDHHMDDADDNHGYVKGNHHNDNTAVASGGGNNRTPLLLHPQHELEFKHSAAIVAFNHRFNMCVSADRDVVFWLPDRGI